MAVSASCSIRLLWLSDNAGFLGTGSCQEVHGVGTADRGATQAVPFTVTKYVPAEDSGQDGSCYRPLLLRPALGGQKHSAEPSLPFSCTKTRSNSLNIEQGRTQATKPERPFVRPGFQWTGTDCTGETRAKGLPSPLTAIVSPMAQGTCHSLGPYKQITCAMFSLLCPSSRPREQRASCGNTPTKQPHACIRQSSSKH